MKKDPFLLTVAGKDRPGIISDVTEALFRGGCNLEDISMTILEREFTMMAVVAVPSSQKAKIMKAFEGLKKKGLTCLWSGLKGSRKRGESHQPGTRSFIVTAIGRDKTGIVYRISRMLARRRLNITDLNSRILGREPKVLYALILEVDLPGKFSVAGLEREFKALAKQLGIEITLKPVERLEL